jgi:hypothetical protein
VTYELLLRKHMLFSWKTDKATRFSTQKHLVTEVVIAYRHTGVLWRCTACPCMEILLPPLEDKVRKGVIKPAAHVPELPVADKDLAIHVPKVF